MSYNFTIESGKTKRLKTAGKYCDRDIVVTASGGGGGEMDKLMTKTITEYSNHAISIIPSHIFFKCKSLTTVDCKNVTTLESYGLGSCDELINVNLPNVEEIETYAISYATKLNKIWFPKLKTIKTSVFLGSSALLIADLGKVESIAASTFNKCTAIKTLILRKTDSVCTLSNTNAFMSTPFFTLGGSAKVYVPRALIESYKAETNWTTIYSKRYMSFEPLEGSPYESEDWGKEE